MQRCLLGFTPPSAAELGDQYELVEVKAHWETSGIGHRSGRGGRGLSVMLSQQMPGGKVRWLSVLCCLGHWGKKNNNKKINNIPGQVQGNLFFQFQLLLKAGGGATVSRCFRQGNPCLLEDALLIMNSSRDRSWYGSGRSDNTK